MLTRVFFFNAPATTEIYTLALHDALPFCGPDGQNQVISTDHLRGFWLDPGLMARIAAIHALGDIWAMGAKPQAALATLILPRLSPDLQRIWMAEIMGCANEVFGAQGVAIIGGHSSLGAEVTIGFKIGRASCRERV